MGLFSMFSVGRRPRGAALIEHLPGAGELASSLLAMQRYAEADVGPGFDEPPPPPSTALPRLPPPLIRAHGEAIRIMMAAQTELAIAAWPPDAARLVVVRAVAEREATFAVGAGERYLEAGYSKTREAL